MSPSARDGSSRAHGNLLPYAQFTAIPLSMPPTVRSAPCMCLRASDLPKLTDERTRILRLGRFFLVSAIKFSYSVGDFVPGSRLLNSRRRCTKCCSFRRIHQSIGARITASGFPASAAQVKRTRGLHGLFDIASSRLVSNAETNIKGCDTRAKIPFGLALKDATASSGQFNWSPSAGIHADVEAIWPHSG